MAALLHTCSISGEIYGTPSPELMKARGVRRADLLSVPVDLMRRRNLGVSQVSIRPAIAPDHAAVLALADRLPAFGPTTRPASEIADRERAVLATALSQPVGGSAILVADQPSRGVVGVSLLESRRDYFTNEAHGHVAILAVAREAEGQGIAGPYCRRVRIGHEPTGTRS